MAGKLKGLDPKQFFIDHGEKVGLGVIALLVLYALGTANWVPYDGNPRDIIAAANTAKETYLARVITPADEEQLQLIVKAEERPAALVDRHILNDWSAGKYDLRVIMAVSPLDKDEPFKEPPFGQHPIKNLIASGSRVLLNLGPDVPPAPETSPSATPMPPQVAQGTGTAAARPEIEEQFGRRPTQALPGVPGGPPGIPGMPGADTYYAPELQYYEAYSRMSGGEGEMSYAGTKLKGRGQPCIAVRGIIPLHELLRDVMEARHCDPVEAARYFQIIDYVLERQALGPDGQWPPADQGWEEVDRATAEGIFSEVDGFDLDPVPPALTDLAVTMPLPPLITGYWGTRATHPDIANFSLSEEDMQNELKYQRALLKKFEEQQAQLQATQPQQQTGPAKRGWAPFMHDARQLTGALLGDASYTSYYGDINQDYYSNPTEGGLYSQANVANDQRFQQLVQELTKKGSRNAQETDKALLEYIKKRISAVGNILLFRFIDFAVEPGQTYRYRARLVLQNPNFGERVTDALDPSVVEGETRMNGWSNITDPVTVERDTYYFVNKVDMSRGFALFDFYHYDPALGTIVSNTEPDDRDDPATFNTIPRLEVGFGQPIGGSLVVWELNPAAYTFEKDDKDVKDDGDPPGYAFNTGDVLVTALERTNFNRTDHPDLKLPREQNYDPQLVEAVLVQKKSGGFEMIDAISQRPLKEYQEYLLKLQNEPFKDLKKGKALMEGAEYDPGMYGMYGAEYEAMMMGEAGGRRATTRTRSALRKSASRADAGVRDAASRQAGPPGRGTRGP